MSRLAEWGGGFPSSRCQIALVPVSVSTGSPQLLVEPSTTHQWWMYPRLEDVGALSTNFVVTKWGRADSSGYRISDIPPTASAFDVYLHMVRFPNSTTYYVEAPTTSRDWILFPRFTVSEVAGSSIAVVFKWAKKAPAT